MLDNLALAGHLREGDSRKKNLNSLTHPQLDYTNQSHIPHRGSGDSDKHFTIADYQRLQHLAKSAEFDGWLKIQRLPRSEAIGDQTRFRVLVWCADDDGGGYRPIAGQLFQHEAEELRRQWARATDQRGFAQRVVSAIARIVEQGGAA